MDDSVSNSKDGLKHKKKSLAEQVAERKQKCPTPKKFEVGVDKEKKLTFIFLDCETDHLCLSKSVVAKLAKELQKISKSFS